MNSGSTSNKIIWAIVLDSEDYLPLILSGQLITLSRFHSMN
jgi:hypothetical protein